MKLGFLRRSARLLPTRVLATSAARVVDSPVVRPRANQRKIAHGVPPIQSLAGEPQGHATDETRRWRLVVFLFCAAHLLVWTVLPAATQPNLPVDAIEMAFWGREWELGYHKHPPLPAWIAQAAITLTNYAPWSLYLAGQVSIVACMLAVWRLAREVAQPAVAAAAVVVLESVYYFNFTSTELNHNVVLMPVWAWTVTSFYLALTRGQLRWWLAAGVSAGLGLLTKYSMAFLLVPMTIYLFAERDARRTLWTPGPWLALGTAWLIFAPHAWWMLDRDFISIRYALGRADDGGELVDHFKNPVEFIVEQGGAAIPLLLGSCGLLGWRWRLRRDLSTSERRARNYLAIMVLGPLAVHVVLALGFGMQIRSMWGAPLWSFAALALFAAVELRGTRAAYRDILVWSVLAGAIFVAGTLVRNEAGPYVSYKPSRIHFAGDELAEQVEARWRARYRTELPLAAGDWWLAGNVSFYGAEHAPVYGSFAPGSFDLPPEFNPWTSDAALAQSGGVILWDAAAWGDELRDRLRERFPQAEVESPLVLPYATGADVKPARIGVAIVPPAADRR